MLEQVEEEQEEYLSEEEVRTEIAALTTADLIKIKQMSQLYGLYGGTYIDPSDLIQEAIKRSLITGKGKRNCKRGVKYLVFLRNAMKSIAFSKRKKKVPENDIVFSKDEHSGDIEGAHTISTEEQIFRDDHAKFCERRAQEIYTMFKDDEDVTSILIGREDELSAQEIRDLWGMDKTTYGTACRRIRRTLNKKYPEGWNS